MPVTGEFVVRAVLAGRSYTVAAVDGTTAILEFSDYDEILETTVAGAVVFDAVGGVWTESQTLSAAQDLWVTQLEGDTALLRTWDGVDTYGVYVFRRVEGVWAEDQLINVPNPDAHTLTSSSAGISPDGEWLAIGVYDQSVFDSTRYYVEMFRWNGSAFVYSSKIASPTGLGTPDNFGGALSFSSGNALVIGAPSDYTVATNSGRIYVFTVSVTTWSQSQTFTRPVVAGSGPSSAYYGNTVTITPDGSTIAVSGGKGWTFVYAGGVGSFALAHSVYSGSFGGSTAIISEDAATLVQGFGSFGDDSELRIKELSGSDWALTQSLVPDHPNAGDVGAFVAIGGAGLKNGSLIVSTINSESGDGLPIGPNIVFIYSRDSGGATAYNDNGAGFWMTRLCSRETETQFTEAGRVPSSGSFEDGAADGYAWAVGKTGTEIGDEIDVIYGLVAASADNETSFLYGRKMALEDTLNGDVSTAEFAYGVEAGGFIVFTQYASPMTRAPLPVVDDFTRGYKLGFRAALEGMVAALVDVAATATRYTSLVVDPFFEGSAADKQVYEDLMTAVYDSVFDAP